MKILDLGAVRFIPNRLAEAIFRRRTVVEKMHLSRRLIHIDALDARRLLTVSPHIQLLNNQAIMPAGQAIHVNAGRRRLRGSIRAGYPDS